MNKEGLSLIPREPERVIESNSIVQFQLNLIDMLCIGLI